MSILWYVNVILYAEICQNRRTMPKKLYYRNYRKQEGTGGLFVPKCTELFPVYGCKAYINFTAYRNCSAAIFIELLPFATDWLSLL